MGRPVVLSNGQLFVGLDENGLVHDFYYPYVGLENLTNARSMHHKIGVWTEGQFSWTDDGSWQVSTNFEADALISEITMTSSQLGVTLKLQDYIDDQVNAFVRHITVTNGSERARDIRLFMHQVFQISSAGRADTALYVPEEHYILDYEGKYSLLAAGKFADGTPFDQYAVGIYGIEGKAGTYLDAEDGELSDNNVEHGGVDSVLRFSKHYEAGQGHELDYWLIAASNQTDLEDMHLEFKAADMADRLTRVRHSWQNWLAAGDVTLPDFHKRSLQHGLLVIKAHCDDRGSVLASGDSSIFNYGRDYYCYCWPRDASYALWPLIRLGHFDEARSFLHFARDVMHRDGYLMHKYQPDRAIGSTWHPLAHGKHRELAIQEDETASVVFMLGEYYEASQDRELLKEFYPSLLEPAANFMCRFIDEATGLPHASYDLWEEKFLTSTYTVSVVIGALRTASRLATVLDRDEDAHKWLATAVSIAKNLDKLYHPDGYFRKGFLLQDDGSLAYDDTLDISSLYGPFMYAGLKLDDPRIAGTVLQIEQRILNSTPAGGVLRYEDDNYFRTKRQYKGNPWVVSALWLAQYYSAVGRGAEASALLDWSLARESTSGILGEQFDPESGISLGVTPLVWSHAEMVNTLLDLSQPATAEPTTGELAD